MTADRLAFLLGPERIRAALPASGAWRPYPTVADRAGWHHAEEAIARAALEHAEAARGLPWPQLTAALFAGFQRTGDRTAFQRPYRERRSRLGALVLAECVQGEGRYLDDAVDGIWMICEESSWSVPAHSFALRYPGGPLPDVRQPVVDLFSAETGATLAWATYLLGPTLGGEFPVVIDRVRDEVRRRLLEPYRCIDDWHWLRGRTPDRGPNNWNPWIHSNLLVVTLLLEDDPHLRASLVSRIVRGIDTFLEAAPDDGGCDEGPGYWWRAAGSLFDCLETLQRASDGELNGFTIPKVRQMGRFFHRMHVGGDWYVNFADAEARQTHMGELLHRFGRRVGDAEMVAHALCMRDRQARDGEAFRDLSRLLAALFDAEYATAPPARAPLVRDTWLPEIQVLACRQAAGTDEGLFLAAKGGRNDENHNHNDIGNFIVGLDGVPVLIDAGVGVYTRQTFSAARYEIWTMQSAYHNLPVIDGWQQRNGRAHRASDTECQVGEAVTWLRMNLALAYPAEAGIHRWTRTLRLDRAGNGQVLLVDEWDLARRPSTLALHLLSWPKPDVSVAGRLLCRAGRRALAVEYDVDDLTARIEEIAIDDPRLMASWGGAIHRTILQARQPGASGLWTLHIVPA